MDSAEESTMTTVTDVEDTTPMKIVGAVNDDVEDLENVAQEETTLKSKVELNKSIILFFTYGILLCQSNLLL